MEKQQNQATPKEIEEIRLQDMFLLVQKKLKDRATENRLLLRSKNHACLKHAVTSLSDLGKSVLRNRAIVCYYVVFFSKLA